VDAATASDTAVNVLQVVGTIGFAISGALVAGSRKMDWFGVVVLAVMVAVGGGTLRDVLLGAPVFWIESPWFVLLAAATALVAVALVIIPTLSLTTVHYRNARLLSDALGLAVFAALGTQKALELGTSGLVAIIMGVITGIFGGIMRDVLANRPPAVLYGGIYATAALAGCVVFVVLSETSTSPVVVLWASFAVILVLRLVAIARQWSLPEFTVQEAT
jgi:uncharacterized membrane protein YeiH